jgi:CDP-diacylglycerol--glycerol-3-phosphate 3-phosphatidyltransferase
MILRDCKELCDFYQSLFNVVAQFSFKVNSDGSTSFNNLKRYHPYLGSYKHFAQEFSKQINTVFKSYENKTTNKTLPNIESSTENNSETSKAFVIPLIQNGCVNLNNDKEFTNNMFSLTTQLSQIYLATGYFNLTKFYMNSIIKNKSDYQVLTAAPLANGFFGSKGFSKYIPDIYLYLEKCFYDLILKQRQQSRIQISEYSRKDWSKLNF